MDVVRWGILGTGGIARAFAQDLVLIEDAQLVAVASRSAAGASQIQETFGRETRGYSSYEALVLDPDVDVVYVATPHIVHADNMLLCLEAGKPVLCEKPFTMNAEQAARVVSVANERGLFAMEGMWTRFVPLISRLRTMIAEGAIGEPKLFVAGLGRASARGGFSYLFDLAAGGGLLLDATVYPLSLSSFLMGSPVAMTSTVSFDASGVDDQEVIVLDLGQGKMASITASLNVPIEPTFTIHGTEGTISVDPPIFAPTALTLRSGEAELRVELPREGIGYTHEAREVMACLRAGRLESDVMPLRETVELIETMDELRRQWRLVYPFEQDQVGIPA